MACRQAAVAYMTRTVVPAAAVLADTMLRRITDHIRLHFFRYLTRIRRSFRFRMTDVVTTKSKSKTRFNTGLATETEVSPKAATILPVKVDYLNLARRSSS